MGGADDLGVVRLGIAAEAIAGRLASLSGLICCSPSLSVARSANEDFPARGPRRHVPRPLLPLSTRLPRDYYKRRHHNKYSTRTLSSHLPTSITAIHTSISHARSVAVLAWPTTRRPALRSIIRRLLPSKASLLSSYPKTCWQPLLWSSSLSPSLLRMRA